MHLESRVKVCLKSRYVIECLNQESICICDKTDHLRTRTEIHLLLVHDRPSDTHALSRNTKH